MTAEQLGLFGTAAPAEAGVSKGELLERYGAVARICTRCPLAATRTNVVYGMGNPEALIMLIGEGPGQNEDETGLPFVGRAGKLLDKILDSVGMTREKDIYIANAVKCLDGPTRVLTEEGSKRLNWIVKHRWAGKVKSVAADGTLVWRKITGWHRSPLAGRTLYKVSFIDGRQNNHGDVGVIATGDHPMLTRRGWVNVEQLRPDDFVATGTPAPGPRAKQILVGSMLGDGSVSPGGVYTEGHSIKQASYLNLKLNVLAGFGVSTSTLAVGAGNGQRYETARGSIARSFYFHDLRIQWYPQGKKIIPAEELKHIDLLGLAIWYLDDGYWRYKTKNGKVRDTLDVEIALGNLDDASLQRAVDLFSFFGFQTYTKFAGTWRLKFRYREGERFLEAIAPYVPESMRYKLPERLRCIPFNLESYQEEPALTDWRPVTVTPLPRQPELVYCIDVEETANFVTPGGVVHNCRPPGNRTPTLEEMDACRPYLEEQLAVIQPKLVLLAGASAVKTILKAKESMTKLRGQWIEKHGRLYMPIFHPAYLLRNESREPGSPKWLMWQDIQVVKAKYDELRGRA